MLKRMKDMRDMVEAAPGMVAQAQQLSAQAQQMAAAQQAAYQVRGFPLSTGRPPTRGGMSGSSGTGPSRSASTSFTG
jgi:hypothetical protein